LARREKGTAAKATISFTHGMVEKQKCEASCETLTATTQKNHGSRKEASIEPYQKAPTKQATSQAKTVAQVTWCFVVPLYAKRPLPAK